MIARVIRVMQPRVIRVQCRRQRRTDDRDARHRGRAEVAGRVVRNDGIRPAPAGQRLRGPGIRRRPKPRTRRSPNPPKPNPSVMMPDGIGGDVGQHDAQVDVAERPVPEPADPEPAGRIGAEDPEAGDVGAFERAAQPGQLGPAGAETAGRRRRNRSALRPAARCRYRPGPDRRSASRCGPRSSGPTRRAASSM